MKIKNKIMQMDIGLLTPNARAGFARSCGFKDGSEKHRRMAQMADEVLQKGIAGLSPAAVVSAYDGNVLAGDSVVLDGVTFRCSAFKQINAVRVRKFYAFILTVGQVSAPSDEVMDLLYADFWGTAFTDAAMDELTQSLARDAGDGSHIAKFGPGFYGMSVSNIPLIFSILDGSAIGVEVCKDSGCMVPLKSCAGFMVATDGAAELTAAACMSCTGNRGGCRLCKNRIRQF